MTKLTQRICASPRTGPEVDSPFAALFSDQHIGLAIRTCVHWRLAKLEDIRGIEGIEPRGGLDSAPFAGR